MRYTVENEFLRVEVDSLGAELASVVDKASGAEMLWQGDPAVWPRRAPILFPYCGKLVNGSFTVEGKQYAGGQHGFARDLEHEFLGCDGTALRFRLTSSAETLALFPFDFVLESTYALEGRTLGEALLAPTKIYVKPVLAVLEQVHVRGISHITGGGFYENIPRSLKKGCCARIRKSDVRTPALFGLLQEAGGIPERDMFNTFNMGVGMILVVAKEDAARAVEILKANGEDAWVLGEIVAGDGVELC